MIIDTLSLDSKDPIKADVCIIGGGAAGITIAMELDKAGISVAILESGGLDPDGNTQSLSDGTNTGRPYFPVIATSTRYLGGNTNRWGSWCRPLDAMDLEPRDWVPHSGWPVTREELDPYYLRAHTVLGLRDYNYDVASFLKSIDSTGLDEIDFDSDEILTKIWQFKKPPRRFGKDFREDLSQSENISLYLHAIVTDIVLAENGTGVRELSVKNFEGFHTQAVAKHYILASGGIENPRILLASRNQDPNGVGNQNDNVGRYFMEHPHLHRNGMLLFTGLSDYPTLYNSDTQYTQKVVGGICPSQSFQRDKRILNFSATFKPSEKMWGTAEFAEGSYEYVSNMLWDLSKLPGILYRKMKRKVTGEKYRAPERLLVDINSRWEQAPNPESRIKLDDTAIDAMGMPRTNIHWKLLGIDRKTAFEVHSAIGRAVGAQDLGRFQLELAESKLADDEDW
ncbi:MAG: GMC family oxidoreductase, partial [Bdellovibrionales bacterium]|nr:GMC family oxidoreductase [Bdellovibrionales bacterium]